MIYLGCPYWDESEDVRNLRVQTSVNAAEWIAKSGGRAYSPLAHSWPFLSLSEGYWRSHGVDMVGRCDLMAVLMLAGWQDSRGLKLEIEAARIRDLPVRPLHLDGVGFKWGRRDEL